MSRVLYRVTTLFLIALALAATALCAGCGYDQGPNAQGAGGGSLPVEGPGPEDSGADGEKDPISRGSQDDGDSGLMQAVDLGDYCEAHGREFLDWVERVDSAIESGRGDFGDGMGFEALLSGDEDLYGPLKGRLVQGLGPEAVDGLVERYGEERVDAWKSQEPFGIADGMRRFLRVFTGVDLVEDESRRAECEEQIDATVERLAGDAA